MTAGILYLIPTTLGDSGLPRAIPEETRRIAASLTTFVVEHPKTARHFLKQVGTATPLQELTLLSLNEHTTRDEVTALLAPLLAGQDVGLISEAGCPAVADPGAELVRLAQEAGVRIVPLVGPSSIMLALMASGMNGQHFAFHGYLPAEKNQRIQALREIERESKERNQTQIFIETPYRNQQLLEGIVQTCSAQTELCIACDLTLPTELVATRTISNWRNALPDISKRPATFLLYVRR
jgi:16S rRNA (cytidine1402-2'-O)-methyltransferase